MMYFHWAVEPIRRLYLSGYNRVMKKFWFIALILAACAGNPTPQVVLPTVAELPTLTPTESPVPSATPTDTPTPTSTFTATVTPTLTLTVTPSITITDTPSPTATNTATPTPRQGALFLLDQLADSVTVLPQELRPSPATPFVFEVEGSLTPAVTPQPVTCTVQPSGGFGMVFIGNPAISGLIGCPQGTITSVTSAEQAFERGTMLWLSGPIYVLYSDGRLQQYTDTFVDGVDPVSGGETPPTGLLEPVRGFGKVWRSSPDVRSGLGWGIAPEAGGSATMLRFERGWMVDLTQRGDVLVLSESAGTWQSYAGNY
jgi:hypothetical protein